MCDEFACGVGEGEGLRMMVVWLRYLLGREKKRVCLLESHWINLYPCGRSNREELTSAGKAGSPLHLLIW